MPFQLLISQQAQKKKQMKSICNQYPLRKEEDSAMTQSISSFPKDEERASLSTSFRGSVSIEAALVIPIFFFAVCCLCYLLEIMSIQSYVHTALHDAGRKVAKEIYINPFVSPSRVESDMIENIGAERLERSIIEGGSAGLDASGTVASPTTGIVQMHVKYKILLPIRLFGRLGMSCEDGFRIKGWNGYQKEGMFTPTTGIVQMHVKYKILLPIRLFGRLGMSCEDGFRIKGWNGYQKEGMFTPREDIVYITETGIVYHKDYHCTYLDLSIQMAAKTQIQTMRNEVGEKYHACERCGMSAGNRVYITKQGNRYHSSLGCSGLKRKIYAIPKSEVMGKGACSRCGS